MSPLLTRADAAEMDRDDGVAAARRELELPPGTIYLDGNSLGPLPRAAARRVEEVVRRQWGQDLIRSWNLHGWIDLPRRLGSLVAPLVGASGDEVVVTDSVSVNLFKLLAAALRLRHGRPVILTEGENFPTDLYMAQGLVDLLGERARLEVVPRRRLRDVLDDEVAVLMLTHVDFRSGELHDMADLTAAAHDAGALALWDLSHSAGVLPVRLDENDVDLAVGCGYKYLNGGPGAPAFAFAARRLHRELRSPLWGWMGHASPFDFSPTFHPADGVDRLLCGTPPVLSLAALQDGLELVARVGVATLRKRSCELGDLLIRLVEQECGGHGLILVSPTDAERRGSQVSYRHPEGYAIMQALIARGVVGDFRAPDLLRFGLSPLCLRFVDLWDAASHLRAVLEDEEWRRPEHRRRAPVT